MPIYEKFPQFWFFAKELSVDEISNYFNGYNSQTDFINRALWDLSYV